MISEAGSRPVTPEARRLTKVLHVVPTTVARGAQVYARALVDLLNDGPGQCHTLLSLFGGSSGIRADASLGLGGGSNPAAGFDPVAAVRLHRFVSEHSPDVVVAHGGEPLKFVVGSLNRVPVVYHAIGTVGASVRGTLRRRLWTWLVARAEAVVAVSDDVAQECRELLGVGGAKLVVVPNGRDTNTFRPRDADRDAPGRVPVVLFVGRLTEGKRPGAFVDLVAAVRARGLEVEAWLVGDGPLRKDLEEPASAAGVAILGERGDIPELMRSADLFVFPSLPEGEGMPGVLIEAGLSGLPVLATDVPGASTVVKEGVTGSVFATADLASMSVRACELLADRGRRTAMGEAARSRCESAFGMEVSAKGWRELLDGLAAR
jgi:glycosyltransferase involved in cell wall biosynthesis